MNTEDRELFKLEQELKRTERELKSEKTKRTVIMVLVYSVFSGLLFYFDEKPKDIEDLLLLLGASLFAGGLIYGVPLILHELVTSCFTRVESLESRKNHLENEISKRK